MLWNIPSTGGGGLGSHQCFWRTLKWANGLGIGTRFNSAVEIGCIRCQLFSMEVMSDSQRCDISPSLTNSIWWDGYPLQMSVRKSDGSTLLANTTCRCAQYWLKLLRQGHQRTYMYLNLRVFKIHSLLSCSLCGGRGGWRSLCHYNLLILNLSCSSFLCILSKIVVYYCLLFCVLHKPFNSQKWLTSNFSLQYPYIIQQTGSENTPTYQVEVVVLIQHQILVTNLNGNM